MLGSQSLLFHHKRSQGIWAFLTEPNPPLASVRFAEWLLSPFAKGDFGLSAHFELARGGFSSKNCSLNNFSLLN
jgi:hypothetical protein